MGGGGGGGFNREKILYTGGLIFGMVRVLVNWWDYTWEAYIRGGAYIRRFTVCQLDEPFLE